MRERGVSLKYERDFKSFNMIVKDEKNALGRLTIPTSKDPKDHDICISPKEKK